MKIFISYSHDSEEHKEWVKGLAKRLIINKHEVRLDQFDLKLGQNISSFMEKSLQWADKVFIVMTPNYKRKADERQGGVGKEYSVISYEIFQSNLKDEYKYIPLIIGDNFEESTPFYLRDFLAQQLFLDLDYDNCFNAFLQKIVEIEDKSLSKKGSSDNFENPIIELMPKDNGTFFKRISCEILDLKVKEFKSSGAWTSGGKYNYCDFYLSLILINLSEAKLVDVELDLKEIYPFFENEHGPEPMVKNSGRLDLIHAGQSKDFILPKIRLRKTNVIKLLEKPITIKAFFDGGSSTLEIDFSRLTYEKDYIETVLNPEDFSY